MSFKNWLALIAVPVKNGYAISTGVPLSKQHVLTTAHGIPSDPKIRIILKFVDDTNNNLEWREARVVWRGKENCDAVLLEINKDMNIQSCIYSSNLPLSNVTWEGAGFPAAGKIASGDIAGKRDTVGLKGDFYHAGGAVSGNMELDVSAPPSIPGLWRGISGSPILIGERLVGIITMEKENFEERLYGVSIRKMLEDEDFKRILGVTGREERLKSLKEKVLEILKSNNKLMELFQTEPALRQYSTPHDTVEKLFVLDIDVFLKMVLYLCNQIKDDQTAADIEKLLNLLLPVIYDPGCVESTRLGVEQGIIHSIPVATRTIAEIIMAGVDNRSASYIKPITGDSYPVGVPLIETPPETGFGLDNEYSKQNAFEEHMFMKFIVKEDRYRSVPAKRTLVNDQLEYISNLEHISNKVNDSFYRHYFIYQLPPEDSPARNRVLSNIEELRKLYPRMLFISLSDSDESLIAERKICRPLKDFFVSRKEKGVVTK
ncbi:MAG TPA: hypothetical protein VHP36_04920 [Chitinispirillaceae bacterium]|nr:hypothetical protein [Chitinispirillaceae bacterium]